MDVVYEPVADQDLSTSSLRPRCVHQVLDKPLPFFSYVHTGFPRYREFRKCPGISKTVFRVMKSPGICNFHHFSVNRPGIWFALEMSGPERSVRFKAANK